MSSIPDADAIRDLTDGLAPPLHISYQVTIVANLMAFADSPGNAARFGIRTREWRVLGALVRTGPVTAATLVRVIRQDKGSVSRAVAALETRGLVERRNNPRHARSPFLHLTPAGRALVESIWPVFREQAERLSSGLDRAEQETLCRLLDKLRLHADAVRAELD